MDVRGSCFLDSRGSPVGARNGRNATYNVSNLFGSELDELDEDITIRPANRVQQWCSSSIHIDGIGGFELGNSTTPDSKENEDEPAMQLVFLLSESYEGFGDTLWSSARYIANVRIGQPKAHALLY
jgi:hypothetical protein